MEPIFEKAKEQPRRLVYAEGEERRVLQAAQQVIDEGLAFPILIGRPDVVEYRLKEFGLRMRAGEDFELVNPLSDPRFREYWAEYHEIMGRKGVSPDAAKTMVRIQNTVIAALMVRRGDAHAMLCGTVGPYRPHLKNLVEVIGKAKGVRDVSTLVALILPHGTYFMCDTHVTPNPTSEEIAEMTLLAAEEIRRFGITPKAALLSHSSFGSFDTESSLKMRAAVEILHQRAPELEVDGEMHAEAALSEEIRQATFPASKLKGQANLLIAPNIESAHIAHGLLKMLGGGVSVGPMLLGAAKPAHVVTQSITVRGLVNMSALTVVQAQVESDEVATNKARATRVK